MEKNVKKHKGRNKFKNILRQDLQPACSFWDRAAVNVNQDASSVNWNCPTEQTGDELTAADGKKQQDVTDREHQMKPGDMFWWLTEEEAETFLYLESQNRHPIRFPLPGSKEAQDVITLRKKKHRAAEVLSGHADDDDNHNTRPQNRTVGFAQKGGTSGRNASSSER